MSTILTSVDGISFRLTINKISKLKSSRSNPVDVHDLPWQIELYRREAKTETETDADSLSFYLHCKCVDKSKWFCAAMAIIRLQSFKSVRSPLIMIQPWAFSADELVWSRKEFIRWTDLIGANNGYVKNDQCIVDIQILARKFDHNTERSLKLTTFTENFTKFSFQIENVLNEKYLSVLFR